MSFTLKTPFFHSLFQNFSKVGVFVLKIASNFEDKDTNFRKIFEKTRNKLNPSKKYVFLVIVSS